MVKGKRWLSWAVCATVLMIVTTACGGDDDPNSPANTPEGLTGSITISGSSTVEPVSSLVAQLFNETNPDVEISVDGPGTGDGFELFC